MTLAAFVVMMVVAVGVRLHVFAGVRMDGWVSVEELVRCGFARSPVHGTGTGVFPVGGGLHRPEIRLQAIQLFTIFRGSRSTPHPYAWARPLLSWHAIVPFTFRIQVSH